MYRSLEKDVHSEKLVKLKTRVSIKSDLRKKKIT